MSSSKEKAPPKKEPEKKKGEEQQPTQQKHKQKEFIIYFSQRNGRKHSFKIGLSRQHRFKPSLWKWPPDTKWKIHIGPIESNRRLFIKGWITGKNIQIYNRYLPASKWHKPIWFPKGKFPCKWNINSKNVKIKLAHFSCRKWPDLERLAMWKANIWSEFGNWNFRMKPSTTNHHSQ
jgi:hypothetical protein